MAMFVMWSHGVANHVRMQFHHLRRVGADTGDISSFFASFGVGEVACWEERDFGGIRGAAEDDVAGADVLFEETGVFGVCRGENFFFGFAVVGGSDGVDVCWVRGLRVVEFGEELVGGFEVVGYKIHVMYLVASKE